MAGKSNLYGKRGWGFLCLLIVPFAAVGVGMTWWCAHIVLLQTAMESWVETPANIISVELKGNHEDSTTRAVAVYDYEFGGQKYTGDRVGISSESDNIGGFQGAAYQELKQHLDQHKKFRCYVNPSNPSESVLYRNLRGEMLIFYTSFAALFGSMGFGLLAGAFFAARQAPAASVDVVPDDQPWLARSDWATGQIRASGGAAVAVPVLLVLVLFWNFASLPLYWKLSEILHQQSALKWLSLIFPAVGAVLLLSLIRQWIASRKFGKSVLQLASTPGLVGGPLAGVVRIPTSFAAAEGFRLCLNCFAVAVTSKGGRHDEVIWQDERLGIEPLRDDGNDETVLPVLFAIPYDAQETARTASSFGIHWRLDVSAKLPGVDYNSRFDVPVFKTANSRPDFQLDTSLAATYSTATDGDLPLREAKIGKELLPGGGVRFVFPAARNWSSALPLTLILILVGGVVFFIGPKSMPVFGLIMLGLFVLGIGWLVTDMWFYRSVVTAVTNELSGRGGLFGLGKPWSVTSDKIERFTTTQSMSSGTKVWKNIVVALSDGTQRTIGKGISSRAAQDFIMADLNTALGRDKT